MKRFRIYGINTRKPLHSLNNIDDYLLGEFDRPADLLTQVSLESSKVLEEAVKIQVWDRQTYLVHSVVFWRGPREPLPPNVVEFLESYDEAIHPVHPA